MLSATDSVEARGGRDTRSRGSDERGLLRHPVGMDGDASSGLSRKYRTNVCLGPSTPPAQPCDRCPTRPDRPEDAIPGPRGDTLTTGLSSLPLTIRLRPSRAELSHLLYGLGRFYAGLKAPRRSDITSRPVPPGLQLQISCPYAA